MSPIGVWCHLGAQEQACRRSKCVNSVLVSSASSHEVCVREPRAALCPANRRGRAPPRRRRAPAPRALPPTKPSVPPRPGKSSPGAGAPFVRSRLQVRGQSSRGGAAPSHATSVGLQTLECPRAPAPPAALSPLPPGTAPRRRRGRRVARASTAMGCQQAGKSRPSTSSASRELGRSLGLARVKGWPLLHSLESRVLSPIMVRACGSIIAARVTCVLTYVRYWPL